MSDEDDRAALISESVRGFVDEFVKGVDFEPTQRELLLLEGSARFMLSCLIPIAERVEDVYLCTDRGRREMTQRVQSLMSAKGKTDG